MLKSLLIQDYALIERIFIEFGNGLNIITGETGAGKSILIDAMDLLLGGRASVENVRKNAQKTIVEGIFEVDSNDKLKNFFSENDIEFQPELILRREISLKGSNRCFINDTPVPLNLIKDAGNLMVDIHGQHEHQSLLRTETHIEILDDFGNYQNLVEEFRNQKQKLTVLLTELKNLKEKEGLLKEKKELYVFQIKEIDAVSPVENEEEKLLQELNILENSEKLLELTNEIYQDLYDSDNAIYNSLIRIKNLINDLKKIDNTFSETNEECESAVTIIKDIAEHVRSYKERINLDPERLDELRARLGAINLLKKKYGGSVKNILEYRLKIGEEFNLAENFSDRITRLESDIKMARIECGKMAVRISLKRKTVSDVIKDEVVKALGYLGIPDARFDVNISHQEAEKSENYIITNSSNTKFNNYGIDEIEFYISLNKNEDYKPLARVASGGEISRIMLALKSVLAKNDRLPLLIFDEIDTGVSGRIAQKVGQNLKSLASYHQIIAITHLPQIAGLADHHYCVEKTLSGERVISTIKKLNKEERIHEVAKLLSGEEVTSASIKSAKELMGL
jgi:DNA repair protein RecN (Recombination protein N)